MKALILKFFTMSILTTMALHAYGQESFTNHAFIDGNNVNARINASGDLFWDLESFPQFEVPKGSNLHTIFAAAPWIAGWDDNNNLYLAAQTYRQGRVDFWPGPLNTEDATTTAGIAEEWDKVWRVTRVDIETFLATGEATEDIMTWPAHGNTELGHAENLAPFVDVTGNGIYEPEYGDYPKITGDITLWWVFNDYPFEDEENSSNMGIEVHGKAYAFASDVPAIDNTIFIEYIIHNRSEISYKDVYLGKWVDFDIGNPLNDFIGSRPETNSYFGYVGTSTDNSYGDNPPAQSITFIDHNLAYFISYNNAFGPNGNPTESQHYYNYLKGIWKDGTTICYGGNGFTNCTHPDTAVRYMYPHDPLAALEDTSLWSEETSGNSTGDRKGIGSAGPYELPAGEYINFSMHYTFHYGGTRLENVQNITDDVETISAFYEDEILSNIVTFESSEFTVNIYPNPVKTGKNITIEVSDQIFNQVALLNINGQILWISDKPAVNNTEIPTTGLSPGIYLLKVQSSDAVITRKVVIQ